VPPAGDLRLPDYPADPHRRSPQRDGEAGHPARRVPQRGVGVRRHVGRHRRVRGRRPGLHRHGQPGPAVHVRGRLQRGRARPADRDDRGQPRDRRADQHLERPQRRDVAAWRRLAAAVRRNQSRGPRPAHPGVPDRRGAVRPRDGVHGRLPAHPRQRARRYPSAHAPSPSPSATARRRPATSTPTYATAPAPPRPSTSSPRSAASIRGTTPTPRPRSGPGSRRPGGSPPSRR
jgi:hypothetical protein